MMIQVLVQIKTVSRTHTHLYISVPVGELFTGHLNNRGFVSQKRSTSVTITSDSDYEIVTQPRKRRKFQRFVHSPTHSLDSVEHTIPLSLQGEPFEATPTISLSLPSQT